MQLPREIQAILSAATNAGYEAFTVGGCVRDVLLGRTPNDWDVTTNATPEEIQRIFQEHYYKNTFGTVTVKTGSEDMSLAEVQITPYRIEGKYTDKRHPGEIKFAKTLEDDLSRRDFTINAMAMDMDGTIIDPFKGQADLKKKAIRTVGAPAERFGEDALRLMRAVRFATELGFTIEQKTLEAIGENAAWLRAISAERIMDEFIKIIMSDNAYDGILLMHDAGLLKYVVPELEEGIGVTQNLHHIYTVWEHNLLALKYAAQKKYCLEVRLASLFHDIGKPQTKRGEDQQSTFYGHDAVGARITAKVMDRLKFPKHITEKVVKFVRYHLFYYNVGEVTESSVRRLIANVGPENMDDLLHVREADRIGSGTPKAVPYKLRHLKYIIDKVSHDPISVKMLKINGENIMRILNIAPGPKVGLLLSSLLSEVLEEPSRNTHEYLEQRARELDKRSPDELRNTLDKIEKAVEKEEEERMKKYYV